uniref:Uncharacterized protein n=1 Tax=Nymphaea colorata TaxID=210225 RepID=A0A5K1C4W3_9MAGN
MEMEGLVPFIYRKIKRHNVRRKYHCLSDGSKHFGDQSNHNPLYQSHYAHDQGFSSTATPQPEKPTSGNYYGNHHRRHNSAFPDLELGHRDSRFSGRNFSPDMRLAPVRQGSIKRFLCIAPLTSVAPIPSPLRRRSRWEGGCFSIPNF